MTDESCDICRKHGSRDSLRGQLVARTEGFWVYHAPPGDDGLAPLGYIYIESDRHVPYLADLTDNESATLGRIRSRLAAALREAFDPEFVFAAVIGRGVAHFHEHVFVRHRGTAPEVTWDASDEAAPRADERRVTDLVDRLRAALAR
jgi:diadenosine tetraphosphate (Ap4A) HIT family hydrolase